MLFGHQQHAAYNVSRGNSFRAFDFFVPANRLGVCKHIAAIRLRKMAQTRMGAYIWNNANSILIKVAFK